MDYETLQSMKLKEGQLVGANFKNQGIRQIRFNGYNENTKRVYYTPIDKHPKQKSVPIGDINIPK